jgi:hypothetical protein
MNYMILYKDQDNKIIKEIHNAAAISIATIHANLIAYKFNRNVLSIKLYDYKEKLLQALNKRDKNKILKIISIFNDDDNFTLNHLDILAINDGIKVDKSCNKNKVSLNLYLDNYRIYLTGEYNVCGLIILKELFIFYEDKMIISKEN